MPPLIINEIPEKLRVSDRQILTEAIIEGKRAEQEGRYYHPAANGKIDEMTNGYSSEIQLASLLDNARLAGQIESSSKNVRNYNIPKYFQFRQFKKTVSPINAIFGTYENMQRIAQLVQLVNKLIIISRLRQVDNND